jgi:hypothetical protein
LISQTWFIKRRQIVEVQTSSLTHGKDYEGVKWTICTNKWYLGKDCMFGTFWSICNFRELIITIVCEFDESNANWKRGANKKMGVWGGYLIREYLNTQSSKTRTCSCLMSKMGLTKRALWVGFGTKLMRVELLIHKHFP